ncbi:protein ROOT HAIR DEFECTIVE 3 homolog 1-like isoform X2 [Oryza glaberrima]|uniref:protein ROOT HAIR DEFECTIVE 3 homolog 1-like isoform X2 n=1 Tax=Oryza glaberrima TaxID=4538 RepID=UPI00224C0A0B|nr:protein ROOT HAIR DEFECTIVE 3 homolog 1-like isoform X2 [Oryza glaberrima]
MKTALTTPQKWRASSNLPRNLGTDILPTLWYLSLVLKAAERKKLKPQRTVMIVAIRDYDNETPEHVLINQQANTLTTIWNSVNPHLDLSEYLELEYRTFPHHRHGREEFEQKCASLREWITSGNLAGRRHHDISARVFSDSADRIWRDVLLNKELNLTSYYVVSSYMVCYKAKNNLFSSIRSEENFQILAKDGTAHPKYFWKEMDKLMKSITTKYDKEAVGTDVTTAKEIRNELILQIAQLLEKSCEIMLKKYIAGDLFSESKKNIAKALSNEDNPTSSVDDVIIPSLKTFDYVCQDLEKTYRASVEENRAKLKDDLRNYAVKKANNIETMRELKEAAIQTAIVGASLVSGGAIVGS